MSIKLMTLVWEVGPHDQGELLTLLALADWANDDGRCWPSMRAIAEKVRVTERSAQRIVRRLEVAGWVEIETGGGRHGCNSYTINPDARVTVSDEETPTPASPRHKDGGDTEDKKPRHRRHKTPTPASPEPLRTIKEPSEVKDARAPEEILCEVASLPAVRSFIALRKKMRKPVTEVAAKRLASSLREIAAQGGDPDDALGMAEEHGWQTIKPDWYAKQKSKGRENGSDRAKRIAASVREIGVDHWEDRNAALPLLPARRADGRS